MISKSSIGLFLSLLGLIVVSIWSLYSALLLEKHAEVLFSKQLVAIGIGFVGLAIALVIDHRRWNRPVWVGLVWFATLTLLVLALVKGREINGARRWVYGFQPSELAKLALILGMSWYCARFQHRLRSFRFGVLVPGLLTLPLLGLIFVEPDRGTTLLLAGMVGLLLLVAGARWQHVAAAALLAGAVVGTRLAFDPLVQTRWDAYRRPSEHKSTKAYQNRLAMLALGEGGLLGKGPGAGTQMRTVPEQHTDFILSVIGEELGLVGTWFVVGAFATILFCGTAIARRAGDSGDTFGMLLATGVTLLITLQAWLNIAVVTMILPNKGIALPFVSRGGSNVVVMLILIGWLLSIDRHTLRAMLATRSRQNSGKPNPFVDREGDLAFGRVVGNPFNP
ncbi:MAG: hypothetical protein EXS36_07425 [Pedosphaera sp.]|nr:hypothetical protein [Pedosphaera sp.]